MKSFIACAVLDVNLPVIEPGKNLLVNSVSASFLLIDEITLASSSCVEIEGSDASLPSERGDCKILQ